MFNKKFRHRALIFCLLAICSMLLLQGCGGSGKSDAGSSNNSGSSNDDKSPEEDYLSKMKEFSSPDKSVSILHDLILHLKGPEAYGLGYGLDHIPCPVLERQGEVVQVRRFR